MNLNEQKITGYKIYWSLKEKPEIKQMKLYKQHRNANSYMHCCHVTVKSMKIAQYLKIHVNMRALIYGAMLHDFYLYNIGTEHLSAWQHGRRHPKIALENAMQIFDLTCREQNIIYSHMWPLTITHIPRSREAVIVCVADKLCAIEEVFLWDGYKRNQK